MGGVARAPDGQLTRWAFAIDDVPRGAPGPVALILPPVIMATPPIPFVDEPSRAAGRSVARRQALTTLAQRVLGPLAVPPRLIAHNHGVRRLDATAWFASVAERSGWAAAVIAPHAIGIDIENSDDAAAARDAILTGVVTIDLAAWHGLAGAWAAREAVLKAMGRDLTSDPGGWRFSCGSVTVACGTIVRVDLVARANMVAAVAYVGG